MWHTANTRTVVVKRSRANALLSRRCYRLWPIGVIEERLNLPVGIFK